MKHSYMLNNVTVAIFDADFQPEPDFLCRTIPYLFHNPRIALVQARWTFVNADECLVTRMQEMSLDYHFTMEQEVGSATYAFFGFNVFVPEVEVPKWVAIYLPSTITLLNAFGTPRTKATCTGLLEIGRVNEWVVAEKLGDAHRTKTSAENSRRFQLFRMQ